MRVNNEQYVEISQSTEDPVWPGDLGEELTEELQELGINAKVTTELDGMRYRIKFEKHPK